MTYEEIISELVRVVEAVGAAVMVVGGLLAFVRAGLHLRAHAPVYAALRQDLGRAILLGLEILIIADIIRTIVVDQSLESVGVLGLIVVVRILLSFSLEVEIDGAWPWNRWRMRAAEDDAPGPG